MNRKTMAMWSVIMVVVFSITVIVYPLIFNPADKAGPVEQAPLTAPVTAPVGN